MRLINTQTLRMEEFFNKSKDKWPTYAILSHTWEDEEVTFNDMENRGEELGKKGFRKIRKFCEVALQEQWAYAWVDTCCINKDSSSELSEAINSMFAWYKSAAVCYVYLADVTATNQDSWRVSADGHLTKDEEELFYTSELCKSKWFTRGWTLQELLAPSEVEFYDREWNHIGSLSALIMEVSVITGIDRYAFAAVDGDPQVLSRYSIAQKMAWASKRRTTREEDVAYCLLGIFDVNIPLIYGEGGNAFVRLQEEIIKQSSDQTIFAWTSRGNDDGRLLAPSPRNFETAQDIVPWMASSYHEPYSFTNGGLLIHLPIAQYGPYENGTYLATLNCRSLFHFGGPLVLPLRQDRSSSTQSGDVLPRQEFIVAGRSKVLGHRESMRDVQGLYRQHEPKGKPQEILIRKHDAGFSGLRHFRKPITFIIYTEILGLRLDCYSSYPSTYSKETEDHILITFPDSSVNILGGLDFSVMGMGRKCYWFGIHEQGADPARRSPWIHVPAKGRDSKPLHSLLPSMENRRSFCYWPTSTLKVKVEIKPEWFMGEMHYTIRTHPVREVPWQDRNPDV